MLAVEWPLTRASVSTTAGGAPVRQDDGTSTTVRLAELKRRVPEAKARVGKQRWDTLVETPLPSALLLPSRRSRQEEPDQKKKASRAYYKMMEIGLSCALDPSFSSVHLCEAPGGIRAGSGRRSCEKGMDVEGRLPPGDRVHDEGARGKERGARPSAPLGPPSHVLRHLFLRRRGGCILPPPSRIGGPRHRGRRRRDGPRPPRGTAL